MRLLASKTSPFVRKVRVVLAETGRTDVDIVYVTSNPLGGDADLNAAAPLGKIPALERDSGPTLFDSRVICRFLDAQADAGLYPSDRVWEVLTLEALCDGIMDAGLISVYEKRVRPEGMQFQPWLDGQWGKIDRALDALERQWISHLHGPLTIGQIAAGCALSYLDLRFDDKGWRKGRDALAAWHENFAARPSMTATTPA